MAESQYPVGIQASAGNETSISNQDVIQLAISTTWPERLLMNLLSYTVVLLPIALVVISTKFRISPDCLSSNTLIQWFVFGSAQTHDLKNRRNDLKEESQDKDDKKLLLTERSKIDQTKSAKESQSSMSIDFLWCLIGLQISYLVWGLLQEKIMTTRYPISSSPITRINTFSSNQSLPINLIHEDSDQWRNKTSTSDQTNGSFFVTFHDSQFLVFINRIVAFITAIIAMVYTKHRQAMHLADRYMNQTHSQLVNFNSHRSKKPPAPLYKYIYCSLSNILSSWCQYEALKYVNFPTQCLSKSCKVIPVMLMSKILLRKRYSSIDYLCALLLAFGMFVFMFNQPAALNKQAHKPDYDNSKTDASAHQHIATRSLMSGLIILALYLTFDSFTSNWQQSLYSRYDISNWQMMAAINFYSILLTLTSLHQLGNLEPALKLLASSSLLLRDCILMSFMSSIGQMFVYYTIRRFGSVIFAVIMTLRQFFSILLSCTIYGHRLTSESLVGLVLVFMVVGFQMWHKSSKDNKQSKASRREKQVQPNNSEESSFIEPNLNVCVHFKTLAK